MMHVRILCACAFLYHLSTAHYTQQWAVHISGGKNVVNEVARDYGFVNLGEIFPDYYHFTHKGVSKRSARPHLGHQARLSVDERVHWAQQQKARSRQKRDMKLLDSDPRWPNMWYLNRGNGLDMNVIPAWLEGITGKGAVVTILDDGLEKDHPDLIQNYDPLASYDVNSHDSDPSPRYDMIDSNRHGTRCAGEVAATSNNSVCALGIAHGAQVGGVRMLDGDVTDAVEARSLSLNPQHIDIYSASWGPDDDGKTVDGPGELATRAFIEGVTKGRGGKGSIFVWASGNGGRDQDNCNCDGYTNSIYSLSISSATEQGHVPWYSEACSSTLASTYSSGALGERQVITTDLHHSCTNSHTGTSASAPLAAGICALALQANPSLTWRDMQHIVVRTARPENLIAPDWQTNGVGRNVSHSFGYGLMDAYAMVKLARKWVTVPEQHRCEITAPHVDKLVPAKSVVVLKLAVTACEGVQILEHVQAKLSIYTQRRGDLHIQLTSPMGTKVTLLAHRSHDTSRLGFNHWPFMSVHSWGEPPFGTWQLEIHNDGRLLARLQKWELVLHGTETLPEVDMITGVNVVPVAPASSAGASTSVDVQLNSIDISEESWKPNPQTRIDEMHRLHIQQMATENVSSGCVKSDSSTCLGLCLAVTLFFRLHMFDNKCAVSDALASLYGVRLIRNSSTVLWKYYRASSQSSSSSSSSSSPRPQPPPSTSSSTSLTQNHEEPKSQSSPLPRVRGCACHSVHNNSTLLHYSNCSHCERPFKQLPNDERALSVITRNTLLRVRLRARLHTDLRERVVNEMYVLIASLCLYCTHATRLLILQPVAAHHNHHHHLTTCHNQTTNANVKLLTRHTTTATMILQSTRLVLQS